MKETRWLSEFSSLSEYTRLYSTCTQNRSDITLTCKSNIGPTVRLFISILQNRNPIRELHCFENANAKEHILLLRLISKKND